MRRIFITTLLLLTAIVTGRAQDNSLGLPEVIDAVIDAASRDSTNRYATGVVANGGQYEVQPPYNAPRYSLIESGVGYRLLFDSATGTLEVIDTGTRSFFSKAKGIKPHIKVIPKPLLAPGEEPRIGRFELINIDLSYVYLVFDNEAGRVYKVTWDTNESKCQYIEL